MAYEKYFGLNDAPFSLAPNPRYLFESASHGAALEQLATAITRREPLMVMTGEIGTGKTLLCRTVLQRLDRTTFASVINNPQLEWDDLLKQMLQDFGVISTDRTIAPGTSRHDMVHALEDFLASLISLNAHAVVIIDEAHHMRPDVLENIRLLSNIDAPGGTMLQIILIGQLDLESLLARPDLRQLHQRVSRRIRLEPLSEHELPLYIEHRLAVGRAAGSSMPGADALARTLGEWEGVGAHVIFAPDAVRAIWRWSRGLPRLVNLLCDRALEAACAQQLHAVDARLVDDAAGALDLHEEVVAAPAGPMPPDDHMAAPAAASSPDDEVAETPGPLSFESAPPTGRPRERVLIGLVVVLAIVAAAGWFLTRTPAGPVASPARTPAGGSPASTAAPPAATTTSAPSAAPAAVPAPTSQPPAAAAPERAAGSGAPARDAGGPSFEILVASFRTEARAVSVAAQVSDAGLPVRRRAVSGWQQVIAGPFTSRDGADAAHQRLERAGLPGTQIVIIEH